MAINGKSNIDGNFLAVNGNSNLDGTSPLYRDRPPVRCFYVGKFTEHLPEFLTCPSVESYGRLYVKTEISPFSYYTETRRTTYQVPVPRIYTFAKQQFPADTPIVLLYERVTPLESSHGHHLPNKCRFCARNSRTLFRPRASGDGTRMHGVLGESRPSCRLSIIIRAGSNSGAQHQQYEGLVNGPYDGSHTSTASSPPRCRTESSWLRAGRV